MNDIYINMCYNNSIENNKSKTCTSNKNERIINYEKNKILYWTTRQRHENRIN